jgi:hypothetical protein
MGILVAAVIPLTIGVDISIPDKLSSAKLAEHDRTIVSSIFASIGVRIRWQEGERSTGSFEIRIIERAPGFASPGAMASTRLADGTITIFEDRVRQQLRRAHPAAARLGLAYILAHELAHAMQGLGRHSESGILKANWTTDDFTAMLFNKLAFTDFDAALIRQRLSGRAAWLCTE